MSIDLGGTALDVAIGLAFMFFLLSLVCSSLNELIAAVASLRAKDLKKGLKNLLSKEDGVLSIYDEFQDKAQIKNLAKPKVILNGTREPSYIPAETFARNAIKVSSEKLTEILQEVESGVKLSNETFEEVSEAIDDIESPVIKATLQDALGDIRNDVKAMVIAVENEFNRTMDRVSGWYKRRTLIFLGVIALFLTCFLNADAIQMTQRLSNDEAVRAAVVANADRTIEASKAETPGTLPNAKPEPLKDELDAVSTAVDDALGSDFPLGWEGDAWSDATESRQAIARKVLGLAITILALMLGAPFWFDTLQKVSSLRATGKKENTDTTEPAPAK